MGVRSRGEKRDDTTKVYNEVGEVTEGEEAVGVWKRHFECVLNEGWVAEGDDGDEVPCVYKVMCSIVQQRMTQMLEEKQLLAEEQGGLRKGRGCRYQVLTLMLLLWRRL